MFYNLHCTAASSSHLYFLILKLFLPLLLTEPVKVKVRLFFNFTSRHTPNIKQYSTKQDIDNECQNSIPQCTELLLVEFLIKK